MPPSRAPLRLPAAGLACVMVCVAGEASAAAPFPLATSVGALTDAGQVGPGPAVPSPAVHAAALPYAYRELHPVRDPLLSRWQHATAREMSGPGASPWYRDLSVALDVTWRLAELSAQPVILDTAVRDRALDMAIAGATSGWTTTIHRTMQRSPELVPIHTLVQSALAPSLRLERGQSGKTRLRTDDGTARNTQAAMADINQGPATGGAADKGPRPTFRTGSAFTLVSVPTSADVRAGTTTDNPLSPGMTSWIDLRDVGLDAARLQARMAQNPERQRFRPQVRWAALVRQGLLPDWAAIADVQGRAGDVAVVRSTVAMEHQLGKYGLPGWAIRASAGRELREDLAPDLYEDRVMVTVRTNLGWHVPQDVDRWPLGHRPGAPGPYFPQLRPTGPTDPVPLAATPAERTGATPPDHAVVAVN